MWLPAAYEDLKEVELAEEKEVEVEEEESEGEKKRRTRLVDFVERITHGAAHYHSAGAEDRVNLLSGLLAVLSRGE